MLPAACDHNRTQIIARRDGVDYVECLDCREIFESSEFRDMDIESKISSEEE